MRVQNNAIVLFDFTTQISCFFSDGCAARYLQVNLATKIEIKNFPRLTR